MAIERHHQVRRIRLGLQDREHPRHHLLCLRQRRLGDCALLWREHALTAQQQAAAGGSEGGLAALKLVSTPAGGESFVGAVRSPVAVGDAGASSSPFASGMGRGPASAGGSGRIPAANSGGGRAGPPADGPGAA